jgi:hypothetical protein
VSNSHISNLLWVAKSTVPSVHADGWNSPRFPNVSLENHWSMKEEWPIQSNKGATKSQRCQCFDPRVEGVSNFRPSLPLE